MNELEDLHVAGGFVIQAALLREQIIWAQANHHAACYFQTFARLSSEEDRQVITVVDLYDDRWPTKSVTNDAEYVVRHAVKTQGDHPVIYRDTEGRWDELRHNEGNFGCFRSLDTTDLNEAIDKVLALHERDAQSHASN